MFYNVIIYLFWLFFSDKVTFLRFFVLDIKYCKCYNYCIINTIWSKKWKIANFALFFRKTSHFGIK